MPRPVIDYAIGQVFKSRAHGEAVLYNAATGGAYYAEAIIEFSGLQVPIGLDNYKIGERDTLAYIQGSALPVKPVAGDRIETENAIYRVNDIDFDGYEYILTVVRVNDS